MYRTCLFCHGDLGCNEALAAFPVGRRLAYDAAKGRLWVVCRRCERWNLTPQEERWEAIEQAERQYRATRLRASTRNVGLARLRDGTELVRIGAPLRPELAAWRYGDQFGRRRARQLVVVGATAAAAAVVVVTGPVMGLFSLGGLVQLPNVLNVLHGARRAATRIRVIDAAGDATGNAAVHVNPLGAGQARLVPDAAAGFAVVLPAYTHRARRPWDAAWRRPGEDTRLTGAPAVLAAARVLPHVNRGGGSPSDVRDAVTLLDAAGGTPALFRRVAADPRRDPWAWTRGAAGEGGALGCMPRPVRLALEMAAHEEQERRALDGELHELERAWRRAEEIAAIADDLLLPERLTERLAQLSGRSSARAGAASNPSSRSGGASSS